MSFLLLGVIALVSISTPLTSTLANEDIKTPDFYVPSTVSSEAQEIIRSLSKKKRDALVAPPVNDLKAWRTQWQDLEDIFKPKADAVITAYQATTKTMKLGDVPVIEVTPKNYQNNHKILIYTHGGCYTFQSAESTLMAVAPLADEMGMRVISIDYTLAPFAKYNVITDQVIAVIQALINKGYSLKDIAIYGDSSGGGLVAGTVLKMRDKGIGMPAAVVLWSPWADITETGDTYQTLKDAEPLYLYDKWLKPAADAYANPKDQINPYVSPVYGDFSKGFPPTLIQGGTKELFLSNFVRLYQALEMANQTVKLDLYEGMYHVFQRDNIPEAKLARKKVANFLKHYLDY